MAVCVSLINMKGGVGKTTLSSQLAWHATMEIDKLGFPICPPRMAPLYT